MKKKVKIGDRRELVTIQHRTVTKNSFGEEEESWADYLKVHAFVEPLGGRDFLAAQQAQVEVSTRVNIRYYGCINGKDWRVKWGERIYWIKFVIDPEERHVELDLMCMEKRG